MSAKIEPLIHRMLAKFRLTGEWFDVPVEKAMAALWIIVESNAAVDGSYEDDNAEDWAQHIGMCLECRGIHEPLDTAALRAWRADNPPDPDADAFRNEAQPE